MKTADPLSAFSIGAVSYLNSKPLVYGLPDSIHLLEPAVLATDYERGAFDIALIPMMACLQNPHCRLLDVGIGATGDVYSVLMTLPKSLSEVKTVSLDSSSRTSVNLIKVILERHLKMKPIYVPHGVMCDAQVLIGTKAIDFRAANPNVPILDLAGAWQEYTGLPFIFAAWAIHPKSKMTDDDIAYFKTRTLDGLNHREKIAKNAFELRYLTHFIRYELDQNYQTAMPRFASELKALGLLKTEKLPCFIG